MRNGCLVQGCGQPPGPTGWCAKHAAPPATLAAMRAAADPLGTMTAQAAADRRAHGAVHVRPVGLVLACPACGQRHAVPAGALDRCVLMRCGAWLKPAMTVTGA